MFANRRTSASHRKLGVEKNDRNVRFQTGSRNKAVSRMRIKICSTTLIYGRIAHTLFWIQDAPSIDIHSDHEVCYARGPSTETLTNSFRSYFWGLLPVCHCWRKSIKKCECESADRRIDRQTDTLCQRQTGFIICLILYAIAMGQVKTGCCSGTFQCCFMLNTFLNHHQQKVAPYRIRKICLVICI